MSTAQIAVTSAPVISSPVRTIFPRRSAAQIRLFVADDHALFRETLRIVLEMDGGFLIVGEASDGREALRSIEETRPDIALIDFSLPLLNGLEVARRLRAARVETRVVLLAAQSQESLLLRMLDPAVAGYLLKEADFQELKLALHKVHAGYSYLTPSLQDRPPVEQLRRLQTGDGSAPADLLTSRERELLQLVGEGYTNREIAELLCVSVKTVEAHKANICNKLNIRGHAGLVRHAISAGIVGIGG